jgi:hypothetical protein
MTCAGHTTLDLSRRSEEPREEGKNERLECRRCWTERTRSFCKKVEGATGGKPYPFIRPSSNRLVVFIRCSPAKTALSGRCGYARHSCTRSADAWLWSYGYSQISSKEIKATNLSRLPGIQEQEDGEAEMSSLVRWGLKDAEDLHSAWLLTWWPQGR